MGQAVAGMSKLITPVSSPSNDLKASWIDRLQALQADLGRVDWVPLVAFVSPLYRVSLGFSATAGTKHSQVRWGPSGQSV